MGIFSPSKKKEKATQNLRAVEGMEGRSREQDERIQQLEASLITSKNLYTALETRFENQENELKTTIERNEELELKYKQSEEAVARLTSSVDESSSSKKKILEYEKQIRSLEEENGRIRLDATNCERKFEEGEKKLKIELEKTNAQLEEQVAAYSQLQRQIAQLSAEKESLAAASPRKGATKHDAQESDSLREALTQKLHDAENSRDSVKKDFESYVAQWEKYKDEVSAERTRLTERLTNAEADRSRIIVELNSHKEQAQRNESRASNEIQGLKDHVKMKEAEIKTKDVQIAHHESEVAFLNQTILGLKKERADLEIEQTKQSKKHAKEVSALQSRLDQFEKKKKSGSSVDDKTINALKAQLQQQTESLQKSKESLEATRKDYDDEVDRLKKALQEERDQVGVLREEVKALSPPNKPLPMPIKKEKEVGPLNLSDEVPLEEETVRRNSTASEIGGTGWMHRYSTWKTCLLITVVIFYMCLVGVMVVMVDSRHDMTLENYIGSESLQKVTIARDWVHEHVPKSMDDITAAMPEMPSLPEMPSMDSFKLPTELPEIEIPEGVKSACNIIADSATTLKEYVVNFDISTVVERTKETTAGIMESTTGFFASVYGQ